MKKRPLLWIGIAILGLVALTIVLNVIGYMFAHIGFGRGHHGHFNIIHFSFLPFLFHVGLIALGWWIWKKANGETVKRWVGIILLTIGLFSLLPLIVTIPLLLLALYFTIKGKKTRANMVVQPMTMTSPTYSNTQNILDEWERQTIKEENK